MKVLKFGGTSVGTPESIRQVVRIIENEHKDCPGLFVVVSAFAGVTNNLIKIGKMAEERDVGYRQMLEDLENRHNLAIFELFKGVDSAAVQEKTSETFSELKEIIHGVYFLRELTLRSLDLIMSFGERLSAYIIAELMKTKGISTDYLDARQLVQTDDNFSSAHVDFETTCKNIKNYFEDHKNLQLVTGFVASTKDGVTSTLGRGGSDFTASIFGAALDAEEIQIWTDVDGVMTANPKKVGDAFSINALTYIEAMELSHFGAKVIHPPTMQPALEKNIPIRILNTFNTEFPGTKISDESDSSEFLVKGISSIEDISLLRIQGSGMVGVTGIASRLFNAMAGEQINAIMITQASSEHSICIAVKPDQAIPAKNAIESEFNLEIKAHMIDRVLIETDLSVIAIVGENMRSTVGISGQLFNSLGKNGINVVAVAQGSSELNISVVISKSDEEKALNVLHEAFFLSKIKKINLFLVGTGLVGRTLLEQIKENREHYLNEMNLNLKLVGIARSKKMLISDKGIDINDWRGQLDSSSEPMSIEDFILRMTALNLPNSIFIDCTANNEIVNFYEKVLESRTSIVTPNKIANSGTYSSYSSLRKLIQKCNVKFLYETNVGAGLPVINTIRDLLDSGDKVLKIEAILSGTISYIFNSFDGEKKFSEIVREAMSKGYTEPDPRNDLNGMDVARKLLILVREIGEKRELDDIKIDRILPESCLNAASVDDFLLELKKNDDYFEQMRANAAAGGKALRYIATYENGESRVLLKEVDASHPFYSMKGSDNIIALKTKRYMDSLMVIKGSGAGADVTAAGVLADILKVANYAV